MWISFFYSFIQLAEWIKSEMSLASDFFGTQFAICLVFFLPCAHPVSGSYEKKIAGQKEKRKNMVCSCKGSKKKLLCEAIFVVEFARSEAL